MTSAFKYKDELIDIVDANLDRFQRERKEERTITLKLGKLIVPRSEIPDPSAIMRALLCGDGLDAPQADKIGALDIEAFENGSKPLYLFDKNGIIRYTNAAFDNLMGYPKGNLQGKHLAILNFYSIEENARIMAGIIFNAYSRGYWKGFLSYRRRDDVPFTVPTHIQPYEASGRRYWIAVHEEKPPAVPLPRQTFR